MRKAADTGRRREMSNVARKGRMAKIAGAVLLTGGMLVVAGCSGSGGGSDSGSGGDVTIEFAQWWEPELPEGEFRGLMDQFEEENPGIKVELLSGPYASTKEQVIAGAATGTIPYVVGPRRCVGQRLRRAGRDRRPLGDHGRRRLRRQPARQPGADRRRDLHDPRRQLRLPDVHQRRPARRGRRHAQPPTTRTEFADAAAAVTELGDERRAAGSCRSRSRLPMASRTTSCRGCGRRAARCSRTASRTSRTTTSRSAVEYIQGPLGRRRHRPRIVHDEGAGQGRGVHQRPSRHDDRLAGAHQPHPGEQPRPEVQHLGDASRGRLHRRARHPLRLVGHRHLRELRPQGRGLASSSSS